MFAVILIDDSKYINLLKPTWFLIFNPLSSPLKHAPFCLFCLTRLKIILSKRWQHLRLTFYG